MIIERMRIRRVISVATVLIPVFISDVRVARGGDLAPGIIENPEREAYYGELHLHTNYSFDAYLLHDAEVDPDGAYRFARGEYGRYRGTDVERTTRPLDFMAVTDHAEWLGVMQTLDDPNSPLSQAEIGKGLRARDPDAVRRLGKWPLELKPPRGVDTAIIAHSAWQRTIDAANRHYKPGTFTTFIAYEWTSMPDWQTLHRNVIFLDDRPPNPFTSMDSSRPEDLWSYLVLLC